MDASELLMPEDVVRLEGASLRSRVRLVGTVAGRNRSVRRGSSLDFADHRAYAAGDDLRLLDQHALARFDQLMIRRFDAEEEQTVRVLLDTSASMAQGGKQLYAARLAALFAFAALRGRDIVCLHTVSGAVSRRFSGAPSIGAVCEHLASLPVSPQTEFAIGTSALITQPGPPGATIVVSDLLADSWDGTLDRLAHPRREVSVVHVLHHEELRPTLHGDLELVDVETRQRVEVSMTERERRNVAKANELWRRGIEADVGRRGHGYHLAIVGTDPIPIVLAHTDRGSGP